MSDAEQPLGQHAGLQLSEDLRFQRRFWVIERLGWFFMGTIVILAGLGLFGVGPISERVALSEDGSLAVVYERFGRNQAPATLKVRVLDSSADEITVRIGQEYLSAINLEYISPTPTRSVARADGIHFTFDVSNQPGAVIRFRLKPDRTGVLRGEIGRPDSPVRFTTLVYP